MESISDENYSDVLKAQEVKPIALKKSLKRKRKPETKKDDMELDELTDLETMVYGTDESFVPDLNFDIDFNEEGQLRCALCKRVRKNKFAQLCVYHDGLPMSQW